MKRSIASAGTVASGWLAADSTWLIPSLPCTGNIGPSHATPRAPPPRPASRALAVLVLAAEPAPRVTPGDVVGRAADAAGAALDALLVAHGDPLHARLPLVHGHGAEVGARLVVAADAQFLVDDDQVRGGLVRLEADVVQLVLDGRAQLGGGRRLSGS